MASLEKVHDGNEDVGVGGGGIIGAGSGGGFGLNAVGKGRPFHEIINAFLPSITPHIIYQIFSKSSPSFALL